MPPERWRPGSIVAALSCARSALPDADRPALQNDCADSFDIPPVDLIRRTQIDSWLRHLPVFFGGQRCRRGAEDIHRLQYRSDRGRSHRHFDRLAPRSNPIVHAPVCLIVHGACPDLAAAGRAGSRTWLQAPRVPSGAGPRRRRALGKCIVRPVRNHFILEALPCFMPNRAPGPSRARGLGSLAVRCWTAEILAGIVRT